MSSARFEAGADTGDVKRLEAVRVPAVLFVGLVVAFSFLLSSCSVDKWRLEAFVSSEDPAALHVNIGGAAIAKQVYSSFSPSQHRVDLDGEFRVSCTGESDCVRISPHDVLSVGEFSVPAVDRSGSAWVRGQAATAVNDAYELRATLALSSGVSWNLDAGDQVAVRVDVESKESGSVVSSGFVYITVSSTPA